MVWNPARLAVAGAALLTVGAAEAQVKPDDIVCWAPTATKPAGYWTSALQGSAGVMLRPPPPAGQATVADAPPTPPGPSPSPATPVDPGDLAKAPYAFIGQAFFDQADKPFKGTAEFVAGDVLLTAAHNLASTGGGVTDLTFIRAAPSTAAADTYTALYGAYLTSWSDPAATQPTYGPDGSDFALLVTDRSYSDAAVSAAYSAFASANNLSYAGGILTYNGGDVPPDVLFDAVSYSGSGQQAMVKQRGQVATRQRFPAQGPNAPRSPDAYIGAPDGFLGGAGGGAWLTLSPLIPPQPPALPAPPMLFSVDAAGNGQSLSGTVLDAGQLPDLIEAVRAKCAPKAP